MSYLVFQQEKRGLFGVPSEFVSLATSQGNQSTIQEYELHTFIKEGKPVVELWLSKGNFLDVCVSDESDKVIRLDVADILNQRGRERIYLDRDDNPCKTLINPESVRIQASAWTRQLLLVRDDRLPELIKLGIAIPPPVDYSGLLGPRLGVLDRPNPRVR